MCIVPVNVFLSDRFKPKDGSLFIISIFFPNYVTKPIDMTNFHFPLNRRALLHTRGVSKFHPTYLPVSVPNPMSGKHDLIPGIVTGMGEEREREAEHVLSSSSAPRLAWPDDGRPVSAERLFVLTPSCPQPSDCLCQPRAVLSRATVCVNPELSSAERLFVLTPSCPQPSDCLC